MVKKEFKTVVRQETGNTGKDTAKRIRLVKIGVIFFVVGCAGFSCKKEEKVKDYREDWCGAYQLTITNYEGNTPSTCGLGISTFPTGGIYFDKSMKEDELGLRINGQSSSVFKLADKNGKFVETDDGEGSYEKGYITSDGMLFYEKQTYQKGSRCYRTTIEGQKDETILIY